MAHIRFGGLALLAGALAALISALALFLRQKEAKRPKTDPYDGWGNFLGV